MKITPTTIADLPVIRVLFGAAIRYQQHKFGKGWQGLDEVQLIGEIGETLHWKIMEGDQLAAFFAIAFSDELVWDERDADPAVYLHRIVTNPAFRGRGYVNPITAWAEEYGRERGKQLVRLDTDVDNLKLNDYYRQCGYAFRGVKQFMDSDRSNPLIPQHYFGSGLSLYERRIRE